MGKTNKNKCRSFQLLSKEAFLQAFVLNGRGSVKKAAKAFDEIQETMKPKSGKITDHGLITG